MRRLFLAVSGILAASALAAPWPPARSRPSLASAQVDYAHNTLIAFGANFGVSPKVSLGTVTLNVQSATDREIVAAFPAASALSRFVPGTYVLKILFSDGSRVGFTVALGATGPLGPQGPAGTPGPTCPAAASGLEIGKWALGLVTGVVAWFLSRLVEQSKARTKEAREACGRLRTLISEWIDGISDAVQSEATRDATLQKLRRFMSRHNFEPRLEEVETSLREEWRACQALIGRAETFHQQALHAKGRIVDILGSGSDKDYELNKPVILHQLEDVYGTVSAELNRVIAFLQGKQARIIPWFGRREAHP